MSSLIAVLFILFSFSALADTDCSLFYNCDDRRGSSSSGPSPSAQVKINPSAVPTEKGLGIEAIYFSEEADLALIRGNGRMGAAISPSNSEETFFGSPGFERPQDLFERKEDQKKFKSQKITLATAVNITEKKGSGLKNYALKMGAMGKYNKDTKNVSPGLGLQGVLGFLTAGYSIYDDETALDLGQVDKSVIRYRVQSYNMGLYLSSLVLSYAHLRLEDNDKTYLATVRLYTASLSSGKFIFTGSQRIEDSPAPFYNPETRQLEAKDVKYEYFGGVQYSLTKNFMLGVLYNYYLLREYSLSGVLFF